MGLKEPFLITGYNIDENNEPYVMGVLNAKDGFKGVVYKIVKGWLLRYAQLAFCMYVENTNMDETTLKTIKRILKKY